MLCGSVKTDSSWVGEEAVVAFSSFGYLKELHLQIYCSIPHPRTTAHLAECKILFSSFVFCNRNRPHNRHLLKVPYKGWGEDSISITIKESLRYGHASKGALNNTDRIKKNGVCSFYVGPSRTAGLPAWVPSLQGPPDILTNHGHKCNQLGRLPMNKPTGSLDGFNIFQPLCLQSLANQGKASLQKGIWLSDYHLWRRRAQVALIPPPRALISISKVSTPLDGSTSQSSLASRPFRLQPSPSPWLERGSGLYPQKASSTERPELCATKAALISPSHWTSH